MSSLRNPVCHLPKPSVNGLGPIQHPKAAVKCFSASWAPVCWSAPSRHGAGLAKNKTIHSSVSIPSLLLQVPFCKKTPDGQLPAPASPESSGLVIGHPWCSSVDPRPTQEAPNGSLITVQCQKANRSRAYLFPSVLFGQRPARGIWKGFYSISFLFIFESPR